ncbi:ATP-binding cassette domain-containing protein [Nocardioides sp. B-3]|uniref:ATP-binding cassette domain-containing protein n=1 Tax=Nocardioides sp. B-3 TaxID=2895565 RepID=UPI0021524F04|nr:ATP-binding cassette domain-containing protein [Nocardioides sp. B-3]UUZ58878.1 ATP-binding cassette domain-containing protein [Nocardioides sp. B-3]
MTSAIELTGLTKSFGDVVAVEDVSAVALPGQVTALLGPNGAGKTTTLRMLLGLVAPDTGAATFDGLRYDELSGPVRRGRRGPRDVRLSPRAHRPGPPSHPVDSVRPATGHV